VDSELESSFQCVDVSDELAGGLLEKQETILRGIFAGTSGPDIGSNKVTTGLRQVRQQC
jgi:hypothetical protein